MTTYIQKKERVFRERGDVQSERSRNVGEMKRIGSCIDRRAWATSDEERRQHILEYNKAKAAFGTYVPVDVLIDLVCATKNAEIEALSKRIEELEKLLELYNELDLTDEQKRKLQMMTEQIQVARDGGDTSSYDDIENSESTTYGVCVGQVQTEACTELTCAQTPNIEDVGAINIDFNIDGSADLEIDVEPVCDADCSQRSRGSGGGSTNLQSIIEQKDREIAQLRKEINQLKSLSSGAKKTSELEKKLTHSQLALASAQQEKAQLAKAITSSKAPELLQLENEIACLRSNPDLTPEQETEIIKKELDVLKRYCDQLSNIQEENDQLKLENDYLKVQFGDGGDIQMLKHRSALLDNVTCERDNLQCEVQRLAGGMEILRKRSEAVDELEKEKCQLQSELNELNKSRKQSEYDLELVRSENDDCLKTLEMTRCERDSLREKLAENECGFLELQRQISELQADHDDAGRNCLHLQDELTRLRTKAKEADVYRLERDRLQLRVEELSALEVEVLTLVEKVKNLSIERDVLKRQACELHNIIADQEHEIKSLLLHVDRLSQCVEKQQDKIRTALDELQSELEHKNFLLASSQEQLHNESQQRLCLVQLETDLRKTIVDLKNELNEKEAKINSLKQSLDSTKCAANDDDVDSLEEENMKLRERIQQLECVCEHKHVDEILKTSKQAVDVVIDEIKNKRSQSPNSDYDEYMLEENKQLRKNSKDIQNMATERIDQLSNQLQKALRENNDLRAENETLKSVTKGIDTDLKIYNCQLEEPMPSSERDSQVLEELNKCRIANAKLEMTLKCIQECENMKKEPDCTCNELKKELQKCREKSAQIELAVTNLNRVPSAEESKSIENLRRKLHLCRDANSQLESTIKCLCESADTRVNTSEDVVIKVEEQLEVEMSVRKQLQEENCQLKAALAEKDDAIRCLQKSQSSVQTLYKTTKTVASEMPPSLEQQELQALFRTLQEENKKLQMAIEVKDALITKMQADLQSGSQPTVPSVLQQIKYENQKLIKEIDELKDVLLNMEKPNQPIPCSSNAASEPISVCPASIDYILAENEKLKAQVSSLQNQLVNKRELVTTCSAMPGPCKNCPVLLAQNAELQRQIDAMINTTNDLASGTLSEACSLSVSALKEEVNRLQGLVCAKGGQVDFGCKCTTLQKENQLLKEKIKKLEQELNNYRKSVTKYIPHGQSSAGASPTRSREPQYMGSHSPTSQTLASSVGFSESSISDQYQSRSAHRSSGSCSANSPVRREASGSRALGDSDTTSGRSSCAASPRRNEDPSVGRSPGRSPTRSGSPRTASPGRSPTRSGSPPARTASPAKSPTISGSPRTASPAKSPTISGSPRMASPGRSPIRSGSPRTASPGRSPTKSGSPRTVNLEHIGATRSPRAFSTCASGSGHTSRSDDDEYIETIQSPGARALDRSPDRTRSPQQLRSPNQEYSKTSQGPLVCSSCKSVARPEDDRTLAIRKAPRNLPPATNEQMMIENINLQEQIMDLKMELQKFSCLLKSCAADQSMDDLRKINEELTIQVQKLNQEIRLLSGIRQDSERSPTCNSRTGSAPYGAEQSSICSRVLLLQEEIQRLREYQDGDSSEVEHLKKIIVQQEYDVDKLRSENIRLQRALQEFEEIMCLPANEQISRKMSALKREIEELKCENECLRTCLNSTSPAEERSAITKLGSYTSNKDLRDEIRELQSQLDSERRCSASKTTDLQLSVIKDEHNALVKSYEALQVESTSMCEELCRTKDQQNCMANQIESLNQKLAEIERQKCSLQGELENSEYMMQKRLAEVTKELQAKTNALEDDKLRMKREQQELLERLEQSVNHCSAQESELETEIQKLKNKIMQLEKRNCSLESEFIDCKDELEKVAKSKIKELEDKLRQANDDKAHLEARLCKMTGEQDELTRKLEDKIREANEREIAMESELRKLKAQIKSIQDDNIDLEKQLAEAQYALEKLDDEMKEKVSRFEGQLEKLSADNRRLVQEKEKYACENGFLKDRIDDLEMSNTELGNLSASNMKSKEDLSQLQAQYKKCMEDNRKLREEIERVKKEKSDMKKEITDLLDKLQICDVKLGDSRDKEALEELVRKMEIELKNCDIKCKDTRQLDLELKRLLEENERLKKQCEEDKRIMQAQFDKSLAMQKEQYDRDLDFLRGRHKEAIDKLQDMHEDTIGDRCKEFEREIEILQKQLAELLKQKQLDDETMKKQLEEIEKFRSLAEVEVESCRRECKDLRTNLNSKLQRYEEENIKLKAELEIAKKCCEELEKLKQKLQDEKDKMKNNLNDLTRTSMNEIVKMRDSVDSILRKNELEMNKMKDYLKSIEAELDLAKKELESERKRLKDEIDRLKAELEKAKKCCDELASLTASLEASGRKNNFTVDQLETEISKLKGQIELLNSELANEKRRLGAEIDRLKAELENARKCCEELEAIKKNLYKDNNDLEKEIDAERRKCLDELERLKRFHEMNDKKYEDIITQLRAEVAEYKKCCEELDKVKRELDNQMKMLKGAGDAEQQCREDLLNLKKHLEEQKSQYETEIARLKRELEDKKRLEDELARLKLALAAKEKCCDDLENLKRELEENNLRLQNAYAKDAARCEEELAKIKAELASIRKQYEDEIAKLKKELENCRKLVNDLERQKSDLETANKALKAQVDKTNADSSDQLARLKAETEEARKRLEDDLARLRRELAAKQKCCDDLDAVQRQLELKNKELANAIASANKECEDELNKLRKELENMRKKYDDELKKLRGDLDAERMRAEEALAKLKKELDEQKRKNDELENLKKNLEKQLSDARSKCDESLENCLEELAKLKKDLERNKKRYDDEIEKLKRELAEKVKCCEDLENMKKELDKANKSLQAAKDEASKRYADEINNLKKDLADAEKRYEDKLTKLKAEMAAERKQFEDEINRLKKELDKYKKCCDELDVVKLALENEKIRLQAEINKLKQDLQNEKDNRKRDIDELNKELDKARQCFKDLEAAKRDLENMSSRADKDIDKIRKDYENQLKRCADDLADCRKKLEEMKKSYEAQIDKLKKELSQKEKCCEELDALKNNLLDDASYIKKQYEDEMKRMQAEIAKGKKCCEDLEKSRQDLAKAKKDCEDKLKALNDKMKILKAENEVLAAKLLQLENDYNELKLVLSDSEAGNKALTDCREKLMNEKKRCEMEIAKLKAELNNLRKHTSALESELKGLQDEIKRLKALVKKGEKCCDELEVQRKLLQDEIDKNKKNRRDSSTQERAATRDSATQDRRPTSDSSTITQDERVKVCPCGALAKEQGIRLLGQRDIMPPVSNYRRSKFSQVDHATTAKKLDRLSKATALIVEVKQATCTRPRQISLTKKSIVLTNVEPSSLEVNKQLISLEAEKPVNLTRSMESILSKALRGGLENLTHEELKGLHTMTKDAVSIYDPDVKNADSTCSALSEAELALSKLPLQRRICQLENELSVKQRCAGDKMRELENTIITERQHLIETRNKCMCEQKKALDKASKLSWENDSLKHQASLHEHRLQQLLAQIEQEKARSTSLKTDLMKAKAYEVQLLEYVQQSKVPSQCAYVEGKLHQGSCPKALRIQKQAETEAAEQRKHAATRKKSVKVEDPFDDTDDTADQDSSEGRGDERKTSSSSRRRSKKK